MKPPSATESIFTLIFIGEFNPDIFHPIWFEKEKIISSQDASNAKLGVCHPEITHFTTSGYLIEVSKARFKIQTTLAPYYEPICDIVSSTFKVLKHTNIRAMGLNLDRKYKMTDEAKWHEIGDTLAPKNVWNKIFSKPGMRSIMIEQNNSCDDYDCSVRVKVEPESSLEAHFLKIGINDHYGIPNSDNINLKHKGAEFMINLFEKNNAEFVNKSEEIICKLFEGF